MKTKDKWLFSDSAKKDDREENKNIKNKAKIQIEDYMEVMS